MSGNPDEARCGQCAFTGTIEECGLLHIPSPPKRVCICPSIFIVSKLSFNWNLSIFVILFPISWKEFSWNINNPSYVELVVLQSALREQQASLITQYAIGPLAPACALEFDYSLSEKVNGTVSFEVYLNYNGSGVHFIAKTKKLTTRKLFKSNYI